MHHPASSAVIQDGADTEFVGGPADGRRVVWVGKIMATFDAHQRRTYYLLTDDRTTDGLMIARPVDNFERGPVLQTV